MLKDCIKQTKHYTINIIQVGYFNTRKYQISDYI